MQKKQKQIQKSLKRRMNRTAILSFYSKRTRRGDIQRIAEETGYSESHISNVKAGRRRITNEIANAMYYISRRRVRQEQNA
jgi:phosphoribosyl-ATP pyrophosphohydrolase